MLKAGWLVSGIAVLHLGVGIALAQAPLRAIVTDGVVGGVEPHPERMAIFWFMFFGFLLLLLGEVVRSWESVAMPPARVGYGLGALGLAGGIIIPASGFWLALLPAALLILRARKAG